MGLGDGGSLPDPHGDEDGWRGTGGRSSAPGGDSGVQGVRAERAEHIVMLNSIVHTRAAD